MPTRELYNYFFFVFLAGVLFGIGWILMPFAGALLSAFVLVVTFYPLYEWLGRRVPLLRPTFRSLILDLVVFLFVVIPIALLVWTLVQESESLGKVLRAGTQTLAEWRSGNIHSSWIEHLRSWMTRALGITPHQFQTNLFGRVGASLGAVAEEGGRMAQHTLHFIFDLLIMLFALFFFFRDGHTLELRLKALFPMNDHDTDAIFRKTSDTVVGVVRGWLLTSVIQGICATIGYAIVGVPAPVLFGVLTAIIGLIPMIGTFGVWAPVALYLFFTASRWRGLVLVLWGAFIVVGLNDVLIRPYLVGRKLDLPLLPLFFALLGGVEVLGAKGIIVGPLLFALAPVLLDIYRKRFLGLSSKEVP